jgi:hypothetical protein
MTASPPQFHGGWIFPIISGIDGLPRRDIAYQLG